MSDIIKEQIMEPQDKYYCELCSYIATNCSNLNAHYKTKKHKENMNKSNGIDALYEKIIDIYENCNNFLKTNPVVSNINVKLEQELNSCVNNTVSFISKTNDDIYYVCTGCNQCFKLKRNYDQHVIACKQLPDKFQEFKILSIKMALQMKQMQNHITQYSQSTERFDTELMQKYNVLEEQLKKKSKSLNDLKIKKRELKRNYNKLMIEHTDLKLNYQKLECDIKYSEDLRKKIEEERKGLNEKVKEVLKDHQLLTNNFNNNSTNFNGPVNIIFGDAPAFKYVNPFINPLTEMPHYYDFAPERLILKDNNNATNDIKSSLCNAYAFHQRYLDNKLVDHVAGCIIRTYKHEDNAKQSFWSTDTSRGSYLVRMEGSDKDYWTKDKDGEYLKKNLMIPLVNYIRTSVELLRLYNIQKYICNYDKFDYTKPIPEEITEAYSNFVNGFNEDLTGPEIQHFSKFFMELDELKLFASDEKFRKNVLIKVASKFYFDKSKCLLEYQKKKSREDKKPEAEI
jgi:hypothetical protein